MEKCRQWYKFSLVPGRRVLFGYLPSEQGVVLTTQIPDATFRVTAFRGNFDYCIRKPMRVSLGCNVLGYAAPAPDVNHGPSLLAGVNKRIGAAMPPIDRVFYRKFFRFVKRFCKKHLTSLIFDPLEDFDFEEWIESANYPKYRKDELREVYKQSLERKPITQVKAFCKDEDYPDFKFPRGIYSRDDDYKVRVGPFFKKFGDLLFQLKWFIKKIPVNERPFKILEKLERFKKIFCTDFSSYEATFVELLMEVELWVYNFSLQNHPRRKYYNDLFAKLKKMNIIDYKLFTMRIEARRMSGEMNTSCGNGVMNLLLTFFQCVEAGNSLEEIDAYFEGDDGIVGCSVYPTAENYTRLGCNIKIEIPTSISTASFCGNIFHREVCRNVTNPCEASVRFGWTTREYLNATDRKLSELLRAKSMSLLYEYPGCPILRSLALYGLRVSRDISKEQLLKTAKNTYERDFLTELIENYNLKELVDIGVDERTRALVFDLYGISPELQLYNERYLDSLNELTELKLDLPFPKCFNVMYDTYSVVVPNRNHVNINFIKNGFSTLAYDRPDLMTCYNH
jgi:hypothetical protein